MIRAITLLLCVCLPAFGQTTPMLTALRAHAWAAAQALAAANPDPVAAKLVTFIRLLMPDQAGADELADFMAENPGWPDRRVLEQRYAEALANDADDAQAAKLCRTHPTRIASGLLRCADAFALSGDQAMAARAARDAWVAGVADPPGEAAFEARWGRLVTQADQRRRFDRLETADPAAALRQLGRLDGQYRPLAAARLALRRGDPTALDFLPAVPQSLRADPTLLLAQARYLRRSHADSAALDLWRSVLPQAEAASPAAQRGAFWVERDALSRNLLATGDAESAYFLADDAALPPDQAVESRFLAGWIALRRLRDPAQARPHFQALAAGARSAITQARAFYWLARAAPDPAAAARAYAQAAAWPLTYYGQQALRAGGASAQDVATRIVAIGDPPVSAAAQMAFDATELARAAGILVAWDDPRRAADFLLQLVQKPADDADLALAARLALRLGLPDVAVQAARLAGRDGVVLAASGWPASVQPPVGPVQAPLVLGLIRQESSFDPQIVSAAGAHGLMQLMPQTAQQLARGLHVAAGPLSDPGVNMRLGTAYLAALLEKFGGVVPYAVAAYDAGPRRVQDWIAANGDAAATGDPAAMIDWIEQIPYAETRNYVQRVLEGAAIYAARTGQPAVPAQR